jgi:predicted metal-dependent phosphoesterase TrpH
MSDKKMLIDLHCHTKFSNDNHLPAHPFRFSGSESIGRAILKLGGISAIETYNGLNSDDETRLAVEAASTLNLPTVGRSDCHKKSQVGRCLTEFDRPVRDLDGLVQEIKAGRCRGIKNPLWQENTS